MNRDFIMRSILAGIFIGLAGFVYLSVGGIAGAFLFAFGLTCVVLYNLNLYTGKAGIYSTEKIHELIFMFIMNAVGCSIIALLASLQINVINDNLGTIIDARHTDPLIKVFVLSIGTGIIMEAAVQHSARAEKPNFIPILLGVPTFILCGMPHSVADAFYYALHCFTDYDGIWFLKPWGISVFGNYLGCKIPRIVQL